MVVVAIVGVLAALAIYGVRKYVASAKTSEARNALGQMAKDASTAYVRERMNSTLLPLQGTTGVVNVLCESATAVPSSPTVVRGQKYQSSPTEWRGLGWDCLRFSMQDPQYYQYDYDVTGPGMNAGDSFVASAVGDLDGDTATARFYIRGELKPNPTILSVILAPNIQETAPDE
jgi:type IV pilus assembly protein PilA